MGSILDFLRKKNRQRRVRRPVLADREVISDRDDKGYLRLTDSPESQIGNLEGKIADILISEHVIRNLDLSNLYLDYLRSLIDVNQLQLLFKAFIGDNNTLFQVSNQDKLDQVANCLATYYLGEFQRALYYNLQEARIHSSSRYSHSHLDPDSDMWRGVRQDVIYSANSKCGPVDNILRYLIMAVEQGNIDDPVAALRQQMPKLIHNRENRSKVNAKELRRMRTY